ncbi:MAG: trypsin-like peptidase domain-containing protein [Planctomycetota bacterium]
MPKSKKPGTRRTSEKDVLTMIIGAAAVCFILLAAIVIWQNLQKEAPVAYAPPPIVEEEPATGVNQTTIQAAPANPPAAPLTPTPPPTRINSSQDLASLVQRIESAIVLITTQDGSGSDVSLGTGFIIDSTALIATNYHVIREATSAQVLFRDGNRYEVAGYRAVDKKSDLAILELKTRPVQVTVLPLSQSDAPPAGTGVLAVGHPAGFKFVVSQGIVSAVHKTSELPEQYQQFLSSSPDHVWIQTSAAISPGSSGGPLLSEAGEVIGINTWVAAGQNLGFASHSKHLAELQKKLKPKAVALDELSQKKGQNDFANNLIRKSFGSSRNISALSCSFANSWRMPILPSKCAPC